MRVDMIPCWCDKFANCDTIPYMTLGMKDKDGNVLNETIWEHSDVLPRLLAYTIVNAMGAAAHEASFKVLVENVRACVGDDVADTVKGLFDASKS